MHILLVEPYFTGSHQSWAEEYTQHSGHTITVLAMPGRFWKWRMHGGAVTLAKRYCSLAQKPDLILATDMLNLPVFQALTRQQTHNTPFGIYFHENQLTYPWSPQDRDIAQQRNHHYGYINFTSALAADAVYFNSAYHRSAYLAALPQFLKNFPDFNELDSVELITSKSQVLPLGLDLSKFNPHQLSKSYTAVKPLILWNHRWEYDKNPIDFFDALYALLDQGLEFEVVILGENFRKQPAEFAKAQKCLGNRILHFGYANDFADYAHWLWRSDILPVTSQHDFFGASVVQAIYCGCYPLLPNRLVYPGLIPEKLQGQYLYQSQDDLVEKLAAAIEAFPLRPHPQLNHDVAKFDWSQMAPIYDETLLNSCHQNH